MSTNGLSSSKVRLNAACAILFGCLAVPALAQSANVTIYGRAHISMENVVAGSPGANGTTQMKNNTSRIGFRGEEDLGNGLKAFFQIESGVSMDENNNTGSNILGGRDTFVGMKDRDWGMVKGGGFYHPYDDLHSVAGSHFQIFTGTTNDAALWANGSNSKTGGFDERLKNDVSYTTPTIGGVTGVVWYSLMQGSNSREADPHHGAWAWSGSVTYENGPFKAAWSNVVQRSTQNWSSNFYADGWTNMLVAGYQFGPLYVGVLAERDKLKDILGSGNDRDRNHFQFDTRYTLGNHTLGLFAGKSMDWKGDAGVKDSGSKMFVIGDNYAFSKRTQVYAFYAKLNNEDNAAYVLGNSPVASTSAAASVTGVKGDWALTDTSQKGYGVGIIHNF